MLTQQGATSIPAYIVDRLNRATDRAAKALRHDHHMAVQRRRLRPHGASLLEQAAAESEGQHPTDPYALDFLETVLFDVMVAAALDEPQPA